VKKKKKINKKLKCMKCQNLRRKWIKKRRGETFVDL